MYWIISKLLSELNKHFETKDLGNASYYLGIQIEQEDGSFNLHQSTEIKQMLEEFGMQDSKPACTPMEAGYLKISEEKKLPNNSLYRKAIGKLLYLATVSRPDIMAVVGM